MTLEEQINKLILRLRNKGGWWEGDENARKLLREFAAKVEAKANDRAEGN